MASRQAIFRNSEIRQQPNRIRSRRLCEPGHGVADGLRTKAIQKEMSHDQIVAIVRPPGRHIVFEKRHPTYLVWSVSENMLSSQFEHSLAAVDAIDSGKRLPSKKGGEESSIPLAYN